MEHILFKIQYPAEFHAQTAVEAAVKLHNNVKDKFSGIDKIVIRTQEPAIRIISKVGTLANAADRDHCIQYMAALGLIFGDLKAEFYEDDFHKEHPLIDKLRDKMEIQEDKRFSADYLDPEKRSIANAIKVIFKDGTSTEDIEVEYPIGHKRRRSEGIPLLEKKFLNNLNTCFDEEKSKSIYRLCTNQQALEQTTVHEFMEMLAKL